MSKNPKAVVIVVTADKVHPRCEQSLRNQDYDNYEVLINIKKPKKYPGKSYFVAKNLNIAANREGARQKALKTDAKYFLWCDSDIVYPQNTLSELILQMKGKKSTIPVLLPGGKAVPAGQRIPQKHLMVGWYKNRWSREDKDVWLVGNYVADGAMRWYEQIIPGVTRANYFGLGCVCMTRELLEKVTMQAGVDHFVNNQFGHFYLDEGGALSMQADELGYECWADGNVVCEHIRNEEEQASVRAIMAGEREERRASSKQAFLFVAHYNTPGIEAEFQKLKGATKGIGDCFLVGSRDFPDLGYPTLYPNTLVPGSNHFILLDFFRKNHYDHYWNIEYDVSFTGDWKEFFEYFNRGDEDFVSSHIRFYEDEPMWFWWSSLKCGAPVSKKIRSFNPIYRISHRALELVDAGHKGGWSGHHECLIPTILFNSGMALRDFGGSGSFVRTEDKERFYVDSSDYLLHDASINATNLHSGFLTGVKDKLFHPVKPTENEVFRQCRANWLNWLRELAGKPNVVGMELGTFRGDSAEWMLKHIFTHQTAKYYCVDPFTGNVEHHLTKAECSTLESETRARLKPFQQVEIIKGYSSVVLRDFRPPLDFVYVDGAHDSMNVLRDAVFAFDLLKPGGILIFDDYLWENTTDTRDKPRPAIDAFLQCFAKHIEVLEPRGWQIAIKKNY